MGGAVTKTLAPHTAKKSRAKSKARQATKLKQMTMEEQMNAIAKKLMDKFDASKTGSLNKAEVRNLCESIMNEVTPELGGVTDEDVHTVMCLGGSMATPDLTFNELPKALSALLAIKEENKKIHALYTKYDIDNTGSLSPDQLKPLMAELNDGIIPSMEDIEVVVKQFDVSGDGAVEPAELKAAIAAWYCLAEDTFVPETLEEAKSMGYTDEQITEWQAMEAQEAAAAPEFPATEIAPTESEDSAAEPSLSDTVPAENVEEIPNEVDAPVEGAAAAE